MTEMWPVLIRVTYTFFLLLVLTRVVGKRQLSQATLFEFITAITIGDIVGEQMTDPTKPLLPWTAATCLWFGLVIGLDKLAVRNKKAAHLLEGRPALLIERGQVLKQNLVLNNMREEELHAHLRQKGYFDPSDVEYALYEIDGKVSVLPRAEARPATPRDFGFAPQPERRSDGFLTEVKSPGPMLH